jgi:predicted DsbA family dithiol-disulfide isomerase
LEKEYPVIVEWKPFELRPGTPPEGIPRPDRRGSELTEPLRSAALEAGLTRMKRAPFIANSRPALEAAEFAKEVGLHDQYHRGMFSAYFDDQRNIGDPDVIRDVVQQTGLDWPTLEQRLESGHYTESVERQIGEAHALGISGVPAYILDRYLVVGAQPYDVFKQVMDRIAQDREQADNA